MKPRVTGIGGIFFRAKNAAELQQWYRKHLGLPVDPDWGGCAFPWRESRRPRREGLTVWSVFEHRTAYFRPSRKPFMINFRVNNLKRVLTQLKREGVAVDPKIERSQHGRFGWIMDPEGHRIELWEPARRNRSGSR
jgi:catechol 2,3-dioxygenase-like lactoylglutathione lyase family enzyme